MEKQKKRITFFAVAVIVFVGVLTIPNARAQETATVPLSQRTVDRGYTVSFQDSLLRLAIRPGVLATATDVDVTGPLDDPLPAPAGFRFASAQFQYHVHQDVPSLLPKPIRLSLAVSGEGLWKRSLAFFNTRTGQWQRIPSRVEAGRVSAWIRFPYVRVAVVEEEGTLATLGLRSRSAAIYDAERKAFIGQLKSDLVLPIASLSKLMTAMVFIETDPDWSAVLTYKKSDERIGAKLRVAPGEQLTTRDAFATMLIGSANNATMTIVRSTGLGEKAFVERMNEKAKALGLFHTSFEEPTGLSEKNVSTATEYARLAEAAFEIPEISEMSRKLSYTFSTLNTKRAHTIKTTNELLKQNIGIVAGKTGYTDEAGYCLAIKTETKALQPFLVVVLGNATSAGRFREAARLSALVAGSL